MPARARRAYTDAWHELRQYCLWPEQRAYELVRPLVLFGDTPAERAQQTGVPERSLRRHADAFDAEGMAGLFRPTPRQRHDTHRSLPPPMRQAIVDLKAEYAALSLHEIARICYVRLLRALQSQTESPYDQAGVGRWSSAADECRRAPLPVLRRHP